MKTNTNRPKCQKRAPAKVSVILVVICGALAGVATPVQGWAQEQNPVVEREVRRLMQELRHDLDFVRVEAIDKLGLLGTQGRRSLPQLLFILKNGTSSERDHAARAAAKVEPDNPELYAELVAILTRVADDGYPAGPDRVREGAAWGLGYMARHDDRQAGRIQMILMRQLGEGRHDVDTSRVMAEALGQLGEQAADAVPALAKALQEGWADPVQFAAFVAIVQVSPEQAGQSVAELRRLLNDSDPVVRALSLGRLRALGAAAQEAKSEILTIVRGSRPFYERVGAIHSLASIALTSPEALDVFVHGLSADDRFVQKACGQALASLNAMHRAAAPLLVEQLMGASAGVQRQLIPVLARVAPSDESVGNALAALLAQTDAETSWMYLADLLEALRGTGRAVAGSRLAELLDPSWPGYERRAENDVSLLRGHVLVCLTDMGLAADVKDLVMADLQSADPYMLTPSIRALGAMGAVAADVAPVLVELLESDTRWEPMLHFLHAGSYRLEAIRALGRMGPAAKVAIPHLLTISRQRQTNQTSEFEVLEIQAARKALKEIRG